MQDYLRRATQRKTDRLSELVTESFRYLLRKQTLVQRVLIDPDSFAITLYDDTGRAILKQRLSEGEKQIFAVSVLWGLSLAEPTPPTPIEIPADSNVEMSWPVFGGECHELYLALLTERCVRDGHATDAETLNRQFRLHLHRGISYLATPNKIRGIGDLVELAAKDRRS